jgi:hypothetical protein
MTDKTDAPAQKERLRIGKVMEAAHFLHEKNQPITSMTISRMLNEKRERVEDHVKRAWRNGLLRRTDVFGVYILAPEAEDTDTRAISQTWLPNGTIKIEIGDDVFTLSPTESRVLAAMLAGYGNRLNRHNVA